MKNDIVNHPAHYTDGKIEVIDYIEDKDFGYHLGNAIKYISRAGKKDPAKKAEDLRKAVWYLERYIEKLEPAQEPKAEPEGPERSDPKPEQKPKKKGKAQKEIDDGKIKALRTAGWTITAIADEMKLSAPTVKAHLQKMGGGEVMTKPMVFNYNDYEKLKKRLDGIEQALINCDRYTVNIDGVDTVVLREVDVMWTV